jgi:hypothetical protein
MTTNMRQQTQRERANDTTAAVLDQPVAQCGADHSGGTVPAVETVRARP